MTILFVCTWNQGRSQIAEALYRSHDMTRQCISAGTQAHETGIPLAQCAPLVVQVLKEVGLDVSEKTPQRLTPALAHAADLVVFLSGHHNVPEYLRNSPKVIVWDIADPDGHGYDFHVSLRGQIHQKIQELLPTLPH